MPKFSAQVISVLLEGINPQRVFNREGAGGKRLHFLTQADVRAHAIRMFGFGQFDIDTLDIETLHQQFNEGRWYVVVRTLVQVRLHETNASYTEAAVAGALHPQLHEALDQATKSAASDAMKRCFINLGDQFGLSLYFNGSTHPAVQMLVDGPTTRSHEAANLPEPKEGDFVAD